MDKSDEVENLSSYSRTPMRKALTRKSPTIYQSTTKNYLYEFSRSSIIFQTFLISIVLCHLSFPSEIQ